MTYILTWGDMDAETQKCTDSPVMGWNDKNSVGH